MKTKQAFTYVEQQAPAYLDFLEGICSFEATAADKAELDRMLDYIEEFAHGCGFWTQRTPFSACGDFLTVELNHGAEPGCVLMAHTDTVHKIGSFGTPAVRREGERMIAPGVIDCKGGIAIGLLAMRALADSGYTRCVRFLMTSDEEVSGVLGGAQERDFFRTRVAGFPYALNLEVARAGEVVTSRRGILRYEIEVRGRGGHAGISYFDCKNAVVEAAHKIIALEQCSREGGMTFSCNVIAAGSVSNVIPDTCRFTLDVRVITHEQVAQAECIVREIVEKSYIGGTTATLTLRGKRPPMQPCDEADTLFAHLREVSLANGLGDLSPVASGGGSDSAYTQEAGVASLCGLGGCGEFCHSTREYIEIPSIAARAKLLVALLFEDEGGYQK
jgi:glutamate carboxypeptidase